VAKLPYFSYFAFLLTSFARRPARSSLLTSSRNARATEWRLIA